MGFLPSHEDVEDLINKYTSGPPIGQFKILKVLGLIIILLLLLLFLLTERDEFFSIVQAQRKREASVTREKDLLAAFVAMVLTP